MITPAGFQAGAATAGLKRSGAPDIALILADAVCAAAGVFTRNQVAAAPVTLDRAALAASGGRARAVIANSGNANACTGPAGDAAAAAMQADVARRIGCPAEQVLVLSTGVIGVPLDTERVLAGIEKATTALGSSAEAGLAAARAILTTDTCVKHGAVSVALAGGRVTIGGIAKGSGMIHPDMATMLAVLTTDAQVSPAQASDHLARAVDRSFHAISVDGDTSTNDSVLLLASGASDVLVEGADDEALFAAALAQLCEHLARAIVRDGEGASRFVTLQVRGAPSDAAARTIARTIATSPLVKTAFAGGDPNWGRVLAAAGRAGVPLDAARLSLWLAPDSAAPNADEDPDALQLAADGAASGFDVRAAADIMAGDSFRLLLDLADGSGSATVWTTDLTHDYITINAEYTT